MLRLARNPWVASGLAAGLSVVALSGCSSMPITHSHAAPETDRALGWAVRHALMHQTLRPDAGADPELPPTQQARAALARVAQPVGSAERVDSTPAP